MAYDRQKAVNYARKYALSPNPAYKLADNDCTNFVSQCVLEGGWTMLGGTDGDGDRKNYDVWWYGEKKGWFSSTFWSWTWANAEYFAKFLETSKRATSAADASTLDLGDIIQIANTSRIHHTMIVTGKTGGDLTLCYHSSANLDIALSEVQRRIGSERLVYWKLSG